MKYTPPGPERNGFVTAGMHFGGPDVELQKTQFSRVKTPRRVPSQVEEPPFLGAGRGPEPEQGLGDFGEAGATFLRRDEGGKGAHEAGVAADVGDAAG